ncbi:MAG: DegT/DnrJ/EryC1/StrS family aminotransferase [Syntrophobacterales bacterium]|jgi:dTDP-4-amino-4,6-dideoxygalactose transaminase
MIPITRPSLGKKEAEAAREVILSGWVTQGPRVKAFEDAFASYVGSSYACAVSSCTSGLHLALLAVGVKPGDIVLTVSHSFIATANAVRCCGAEPVFVDIDPETYNMDPGDLERCLRESCEEREGQLYYKHLDRVAVGESPLRFLHGLPGGSSTRLGRVAAVLTVHQMGLPCDLVGILAIANEFGLPVIEDAACAIGSEVSLDSGSTWDKIGRPHGDIACFSFHPRKVITTGDGGMITTNNPKYDQRFRLWRQHGMSIPDTVRHESNKVIFEEYPTTGFNYRMTDIQAAVGIEQLKRLPELIIERREIAEKYVNLLKEVPWLASPSEPPYARTNWQSYPVKLLEDAPLSRDELMQSLLDMEIATRRGIMNAHQEGAYKDAHYELKHSERASERVILLPLFSGSLNEIEKVVGAIRDVGAKYV